MTATAAMSLNLRTAKALGLTLPLLPLAQARGDRVRRWNAIMLGRAALRDSSVSSSEGKYLRGKALRLRVPPSLLAHNGVIK